MIRNWIFAAVTIISTLGGAVLYLNDRAANNRAEEIKIEMNALKDKKQDAVDTSLRKAVQGNALAIGKQSKSISLLGQSVQNLIDNDKKYRGENDDRQRALLQRVNDNRMKVLIERISDLKYYAAQQRLIKW